MIESSKHEAWPDLPYQAWIGTRETLHLWTQVVGKIRLALTPWLNHSWHVVFYVDARGLTTSPIPYGDRAFEIAFDFTSHNLEIATSDGIRKQIPLQPRSVASFYEAVLSGLDEVGVAVAINGFPSEIPGAIPFNRDHKHAAYDPEFASPFLESARPGRSSFQAIPHRLHRQGKPGAFLLGKLRSRRDAVLGPPRASPSRRRPRPVR